MAAEKIVPAKDDPFERQSKLLLEIIGFIHVILNTKLGAVAV